MVTSCSIISNGVLLGSSSSAGSLNTLFSPLDFDLLEKIGESRSADSISLVSLLVCEKKTTDARLEESSNSTAREVTNGPREKEVADRLEKLCLHSTNLGDRQGTSYFSV